MAPGPSDEYLISKYSILYFDAALGFVVVGILDYMNSPGLLSATFIVAGLAGVASALLVEWDEWISNILNSVSVHLFLFEAIGLLYRHGSDRDTMLLRCFILFGDVSFLAGTLGDVILSYYALLVRFDVIHAQIAVGTAFGWLVCSLVYVIVHLDKEKQVRSAYNAEKRTQRTGKTGV